MMQIPSKIDEFLETKLSEATNPINITLNVAATDAFCEQVLKESEGSQIAVRLLAQKVQSPHEREALYSFDVIDECVKKCGSRFHQEVGKFKFLNELVKVISPKFLALTTAPAVKQRCIECLYSLVRSIPNEPKLMEAYTMLKNKGIIATDPLYIDNKISTVSLTTTERAKSIFETSKDAERLSRLLKSRKPEDLREANQIIKNVVQEDKIRNELLSKRQKELDAMRHNIEVLGDMLSYYIPGHGNPEDLFIMKELVTNLEKSRSEMFNLTRETDQDECLNDAIKVIDECDAIIKLYKDKIAVGDVDNDVTHKTETGTIIVEDLLGDTPQCDLLSNDLQSLTINGVYTPQFVSKDEPVNKGPTSKYDDLMNLFDCPDSSNANTLVSNDTKSGYVTNTLTSSSADISTTNVSHTTSNNSASTKTARVEYKGFEDLDILSKKLFNLNKKNTVDCITSNQSQYGELISSLEDKQVQSPLSSDLPLLCNDLVFKDTEKCSSDCINVTTTVSVSHKLDTTLDEPHIDLSTFHINLNNIKPHPLKSPIIIYNSIENKVKVTLHLASDRPHPNVSVMVAQISTENDKPVTDILLKFAVIKPMRLKKQAVSTNMLPAYSPFTPSIPINEVVLLYHPTNDTVDLKYHLSYELNGESFLESANTGNINF